MQPYILLISLHSLNTLANKVLHTQTMCKWPVQQYYQNIFINGDRTHYTREEKPNLLRPNLLILL